MMTAANCKGIDKIVIQCDGCDKVFTEHKSLHNSLGHRGDDWQYRCDDCCQRLATNTYFVSQAFMKKTCLDSHFEAHLLVTGKTCEICCRNFNDAHALQQHMSSGSIRCRKFMDPANNMCRSQGTSFVRRKQRKKCKKVSGYISCYEGKEHIWEESDLTHLCVQDTQELFQCAECGKSFREKRNLLSHLKIHSIGDKLSSTTDYNSKEVDLKTGSSADCKDEEWLRCTKCKQCFRDSIAYIDHMNWHLLGKHRCHKCGAKFERSSELVMHKRVHYKVRSIKGNFDSSKIVFDVSSKLRATSNNFVDVSGSFMDTKVPFDRYKCRKCNKNFRLVSAFNDHMKRHTRGKFYQCLICSKEFRHSSELNCHILAHAIRKQNQQYSMTRTLKKIRRGNLKSTRNVRTDDIPAIKSQSEAPSTSNDYSHSTETKFKFMPIYTEIENLGNDLLSAYSPGNSTREVDIQFHRCNVCEAVFKTQSDLKIHQWIHSTDKKYKCDKCGQKFRESSQLAVHLWIHSHSQYNPISN